MDILFINFYTEKTTSKFRQNIEQKNQTFYRYIPDNARKINVIIAYNILLLT